MPKASPRQSLPTSSLDFALPPSSSSPGASSSSLTLDDPTYLLQRFRRPSLLQKAGYLAEARLHSPLASSFTLHTRRRSQNLFIPEESESDKERMSTDSPNDSETNTPPLRVPENSEEDLPSKASTGRPPLTPPRRKSSARSDLQEAFSLSGGLHRRLSFPLKQPRILNLLAESRPDEAEVKSEAAFQRLITSCSELPIPPRTPRAITDRGRYPEEADHEDTPREETPSDDEEAANDEGPFAFSLPALGGSEPITISRPRASTESAAGSMNGDDLNMSMSETSSSFGATMDVDMPLASPSLPSMAAAIHQWRYTPPPTTSAVRSNKRKLDDRFDPYPSASKRRAVSPSYLSLRDSHPSLGSPMGRGNGSRHPIALPINIPNSNVSSAASSPTISSSYPTMLPRALTITSSPTLRATVILGSPIMRPIPRTGRRGTIDEGREEREIQGAGDAVGSLTLG